MEHSPEATTFRSLAHDQGIAIVDPLPQEWPLEPWFASVHDTPLADFTHGDLARACRQRTFHEHVVPYALVVLRENPLAGDYWEGELLVALMGLPAAYWDTHYPEKGVLRSILPRAYASSDDAVLQAEIEKFRLERV